MTKADLIAKGKTLGLNLSMNSTKTELENAIAKAEKPAKASKATQNGEF